MKIIQLLMTPNDNAWQGSLLGLADDGGTYRCGSSGAWEPFIAPVEAAPDPQAGRLAGALEGYLEAQDALDNRELQGPNAEDFFKLQRRRNNAREDLDKELAAWKEGR